MTIAYIHNPPALQPLTALWPAAEWCSAEHRTASGAKAIMTRASGACFCLDMWFAAWLGILISWGASQRQGMQGSHQNLNLEGWGLNLSLCMSLFFFRVLVYSGTQLELWAAGVVSHWLKWQSWNGLHKARAYPQTFLRSPAKLALFFSQTGVFAGILGLSGSLNLQILQFIVSLQGFLKAECYCNIVPFPKTSKAVFLSEDEPSLTAQWDNGNLSLVVLIGSLSAQRCHCDPQSLLISLPKIKKEGKE